FFYLWSRENKLETLKQEHQQSFDTLIQEYNLQCKQFNVFLVNKEQLFVQTNLELDNLRNNHTMLLLEKEILNKIILIKKHIMLKYINYW
ncbi:unnamed protein product, partial [Rotaria sp. Silwood2]